MNFQTGPMSNGLILEDNNLHLHQVVCLTMSWTM